MNGAGICALRLREHRFDAPCRLPRTLCDAQSRRRRSTLLFRGRGTFCSPTLTSRGAHTATRHPSHSTARDARLVSLMILRAGADVLDSSLGVLCIALTRRDSQTNARARHRRARQDLGYSPTTPLKVGLGKFVQWFQEYYKARARLPLRLQCVCSVPSSGAGSETDASMGPCAGRISRGGSRARPDAVNG